MPSKRQFARNVTSDWAAMAVAMIVPFFLAPFVVHRLGDVAYGIWILIVSTVGYRNLMDLGMRSSVVRSLSHALALGDEAEARRVVTAALGMRVALSLAVLLGGGTFAWLFPHVFRIPADLGRAAQGGFSSLP